MRVRRVPTTTPRPSRASWLGPAIFLLILALMPLGPTILFRAAHDGICASYNSISNDFCDEWNYERPPADRFPVPAGWSVVWHHLSCGSGGCATHVFILRSTKDADDPVREYADRLRDVGWQIRRGKSRDYDYFIGRRADLVLSIESAATGFTLAPRRFRDGRHIDVGFSLVDEAAVIYE
jgi:hypothetical protein